MKAFDLFDVYRFGLAVLVLAYAAVRTTLFVWNWVYRPESILSSSLVRRYIIVLLLRLRFRRFAYELGSVACLLAVFLYLVRLHWA